MAELNEILDELHGKLGEAYAEGRPFIADFDARAGFHMNGVGELQRYPLLSRPKILGERAVRGMSSRIFLGGAVMPYALVEPQPEEPLVAVRIDVNVLNAATEHVQLGAQFAALRPDGRCTPSV